MNNQEESHGRMRISSPDDERMGRFARFVITILVLAAILVTTVFFAVRTETGREIIKGWLEKRLGMELTIERARIGWPYVLIIEMPASKSFRSGEKPGFKAQEVRIALGIRPIWRVSVHRCVLYLVRDSDDNWNPEFFGKLGDLPLKNIGEISRVTGGFRKNTALDITESSIRWLNSKGSLTASASGISFSLTPVRIPGRRMYHYYLAVYNVLGPDSARVHDIEREWLASDISDYVEIDRSERRRPVSGGEFWEPGDGMGGQP